MFFLSVFVVKSAEGVSFFDHQIYYHSKFSPRFFLSPTISAVNVLEKRICDGFKKLHESTVARWLFLRWGNLFSQEPFKFLKNKVRSLVTEGAAVGRPARQAEHVPGQGFPGPQPRRWGRHLG